MFLGGFGGRSVRKYSGGWKCSASWSERNCILKDPGEEKSAIIKKKTQQSTFCFLAQSDNLNEVYLPYWCLFWLWIYLILFLLFYNKCLVLLCYTFMLYFLYFLFFWVEQLFFYSPLFFFVIWNFYYSSIAFKYTYLNLYFSINIKKQAITRQQSYYSLCQKLPLPEFCWINPEPSFFPLIMCHYYFRKLS